MRFAQNLLQLALAEMAAESESPSAHAAAARRVREKADSEMLGSWFWVVLAPKWGLTWSNHQELRAELG